MNEAHKIIYLYIFIYIYICKRFLLIGEEILRAFEDILGIFYMFSS